MKTVKKVLPLLLSLGMMLQSIPTVWADDVWQQTEGVSEYSISEITDEAAGNDTSVDGSTDSIELLSMLPIEKEYCDVYIERPQLEDQPLYSFYVRELLYDKLLSTGKLNENGEYEGKIAVSVGSESYRLVGWDDIITLDMFMTNSGKYGNVYYDTVNFIIGGDQLDINADAYYMYVYYTPDDLSFIQNCIFTMYNSNGDIVEPYGEGVSSGIDMDGREHIYYYHTVLADQLGDENMTYLQIKLPEGYSAENTKIYEGLFYTEEEIGSAQDITAFCLDDGTDKDKLSVDGYKMMTFVTKQNGRTRVIPVYYSVGVLKNYITCDYDREKYIYVIKDNDISYGNFAGIIYANSFDEAEPQMKLNYNDYINEIEGSAADKIEFTCYGKYDSVEAALAAGETDLSNDLFSKEYVNIDKSRWYDVTAYTDYKKDQRIDAKAIDITVVDKYGLVYNRTAYFILGYIQPIDQHSPSPSDDTYFRVNGAYYDSGENKRSAYTKKINSTYDSYYLNGYQTLFILDRNRDPLSSEYIYPTFTTGENARIYIGNDVAFESGENQLQISGESRVRFRSGEAIQYSAASESGNHLKNYWVTFITPQSGAKLFVNAANNTEEGEAPKREIFLNSSTSYCHDIMFANIGDEALNGLTVSLSEDTTGVKLDEYWTIVDNSVRTLAPFSNISGDNIAKLRLVPADDSFGPISGKLTISSENGGSAIIDLTGIAGVPKIVTDELYDGVKYVPYSSVVMTNCMYETDAMRFEKVSGTLPYGVELNPNTGEIYGIPTTPGTYTFTIKATYTGDVPMDSDDYSSQHEYTIVIEDNSDENVDAVNVDEQGYELTDRVSREITVYYNGFNGDKPNIDRIELASDIFRSVGSYTEEFCDFYIDGIKLGENLDYTAYEGSTVITVKAQTFGKISLTPNTVPHTLAAEFRTETNDLRRSAQNVYLNYVDLRPNTPGNNGNTGNGGNSGNGGIIDPGVSNGGHGGTASNINGGSDSSNSSKTEASVVTAVMSIVDMSGNPISGLSLELHSTPKFAKTGKDGCGKFNNVEFGRHTLYVLDKDGNKVASKQFSIVSGTAAGLKENVITAKNGDVVNLSMKYDGKNLTIISAEDVASMAGAFEKITIASTDSTSAWSRLFAEFFAAADIAVIVLLVGKKLRRKK